LGTNRRWVLRHRRHRNHLKRQDTKLLLEKLF
jgi:hypothetical protein